MAKVDPVPPFVTNIAVQDFAERRGIKSATPDVVLFNDDEVPVEVMYSRIFEKIGALELIDLSRSEIINGQFVKNSPITNSQSVNFFYNSLNIFKAPGDIRSTFDNFGIKFVNYIPIRGTGPIVDNLSEERAIVYVSDETGGIVVDVTGLTSNERVQIQVLDAGQILGDRLEVEES